MQRIVVTEYGDPEVMRLEEIGDPEPGPGEALVEVAASGVNFIDLNQRSGVYQVRLPWTPGIEGSGIVLRVGPGTTEFAEGDRVVWAADPGSYASHTVVAADKLVPVPPDMELVDAAAVLVQGMTAHALATEVAPVGEGDICLVHAAAGGVGLMLTAEATRRGATVIGTVSSDTKAEPVLKAGAAHVINYTRESFPERVAELTEGAKADVVFDAVGADTFEGSLKSLRPRGILVLYGQSSGPVPPIEPGRLASAGSLFFTRPALSHYNPDRERLLWRAEQVFRSVMDGDLPARVHATYPLGEAALAHRELAQRTTIGKVLLTP
jgi:NADPH2:quinone reductase